MAAETQLDRDVNNVLSLPHIKQYYTDTVKNVLTNKLGENQPEITLERYHLNPSICSSACVSKVKHCIYMVVCGIICTTFWNMGHFCSEENLI